MFEFYGLQSGVIVKTHISLMDTFYKTKDLSLSQKMELLRDCKEICHTWWVDKLDCSISLSRQQIDMDFEEIISKLNDSAHFVVIDREFSPFEAVKHFEIGFRTTRTPIDYFLFMWVEDEKMLSILEKYNYNPHDSNSDMKRYE